MVKKGKKRGRRKYKSFKILRTKVFFLVKKNIFDNFLKVILLVRIEIVDTRKRERKKGEEKVYFFPLFWKGELEFL